MSFVRPCPIAFLAAVLALAFAPAAEAQQKEPHVGYLYPAGGRQGETFQITVGGQFFDEEAAVFISGDGIEAKVLACKKPPTPRELNELREKMQELQKKPKEAELAKEIAEIRRKLAVFRNMMNPGISEKLTLQITIGANASLDDRELRVRTDSGLSNPLVFHVGNMAEFSKKEMAPPDELPGAAGPNKNVNIRREKIEPVATVTLPATLNGQISPGGVDRYRFQARQGQRIVVIVSARELIPYLADAVPGWFQAAAAIYDANGKELAYDDHYRFRPDPVLTCKISKDGWYELEIRDALYRGREDFVYRISLGELPFIKSFFPLGGPADAKTAVALSGWNLPTDKMTMDAEELARRFSIHPGDGAASTLPLVISKGKLASNREAFAIDTLPECLEREPNNKPADAQVVTLPIVVNGRIDSPGDIDIFKIEGRKGEKIVADVDARKLDSSLDSALELTDTEGRRVALNDDCADKGDGLRTHHADSYLNVELPADGIYYLRIGDAQHQGGADYAYRLRIGEPRPDFALRIAPSSVNVRPGSSVPVTVYALRKDGFAGEIAFDLKDAPQGVSLSDAKLPAGQDQAKLTLKATQAFEETPLGLTIEGRAKIKGREVVHRAVPADDMMQAFFYHHLVPARNLMLATTKPPRPQLKYAGETPAKLPAGATASLRFAGPRGPVLDRIEISLKDAPEGISAEKTVRGKDDLTLPLNINSNKVKNGQKGNLTVEVFLERLGKPQKEKTPEIKRRLPLAPIVIPYEVVNPPENPQQ
jgi:hypothetical protein